MYIYIGLHQKAKVGTIPIVLGNCYVTMSPFLDVTRINKDVYVNSFLPRAATLWNSLPIECFPLVYDVNVSLSTHRRHVK